MIEKLYTVEEVAELASVTGRTIRNYLKSGRLVGRKIGGQWRFPEAEVQRLLTGGVPEDEPETAHEVDLREREAAPSLRVSSSPRTAEAPMMESARDEEYEAAYPQPAPQPAAQPQVQPQVAPQTPPQAPARNPSYYNEPAPLPGAACPPENTAPAPQQDPFYQGAPQPTAPLMAAQVPPGAAPQTGRLNYPVSVPVFQQPGYNPQAYPAQPVPQPHHYGPSTGQTGQLGFAGQAPPTAQHPPASQPYSQDPSLYQQPGAVGKQQPVFVTTAGSVLYEPLSSGVYPQGGPPQGGYQPVPGYAPAQPPASAEKPAEAPAEKTELHPESPAFPQLSDVGNRVTKFISEVHDYSKGPQICAVVDLHQSFSAARITSQRLADIADEESEAGLLCQSFVEFDERFYVARYTLFGTTAFLLRCLKMIG